MARFAVKTGSYSSRSVIASAQRCVNLYMERNPDDSTFPYTMYTTPGLTPFAEVTGQQYLGWRSLYRATNDRMYGVCGNHLYQIASDGTLVQLGELKTTSGYVSMVDNNNYLILVDGTSYGYQLTLSDNTFAVIADEAFYGGNTITFVDGYFIVNRPGTAQFYISGVNTNTWDGLDFATKSANMDNLVAVGVSNRFLYLFGETTTEIWYDTGATAFPFGRMEGAYMHYGCSAPGSVVQMDASLYWLAKNAQGEAIICFSNSFAATQISTFALSNEISGYSRIDDAVAYSHLSLGHMFYVISFPTANKTWQYDLSTQQWNELVYTDPSDGSENRHRACCHAMAGNKHIVGDWETGRLYVLDPEVYTDNGAAIVRRRGFIHGVDQNYYRIAYQQVTADMECGNGNAVSNDGTTDVFLRWSDSRGKDWGNPIKTTLGNKGDYLKTVNFKRLGMARDRVFEIFWSDAVRTALSGVYVDFTVSSR